MQKETQYLMKILDAKEDYNMDEKLEANVGTTLSEKYGTN